MACTLMHMAIGKRYCEKHPDEDYKDLLLGSNLPDMTADKNTTHFGNTIRGLTYLEYAKRKIDLDAVVEKIPLNSSLKRGIFLHLISDYVFFNDIRLKIDKERIKTTLVRDMAHDSDLDYNYFSELLLSKYDIDFNDIPEYLRKFISKPEQDHAIFYDENEVFNYIEKMSDFNLEKVRDAIINKHYEIFDIKWCE